jgi:hypothetical protein
MIEKNLLQQARKEKGRFRSFLLVTLNRYVISEHRRASAQTRSPAGALANLGDEAEQIPADDDPADNYTLAWGRELVADALRRMKKECEDSNRADLWVVFEARIIRPTFDGVEPLGYEQLVRQLSLAAPLVACNLLVTAKRMFSRCLRAVVAEYSDDDAQIDEELADLRRILGGGA